ncbi:MAG: hypothetical protein B7Y66_04025 [Sphingobacteriia bacterium 35-36-14]|nr:MAG: hypothetical protein B7Y66_04025 [Sphingobacteriia bacterium 35-36-14]OZA63434.1 MAG: hypothetical protein B7X68_10615 [Sphingobacteriia bacterium 39-36-14]
MAQNKQMSVRFGLAALILNGGVAKEKALALRAFVFFKFFTRLNLRFRLVKNKKAPSYTRGFSFAESEGFEPPDL